jgi:uncharacterized protein (DUF58 family)
VDLALYGALLDDVRRVRWPARRRVQGNVVGGHTARRRGTAAEFVEYRAYRQGDDLRKLDWKLLARSDRPYLRLSHEQAILPTTILVDGSASMAFPRATLAKWDLARRVAVALAATARAGGDPVGLIVAHGDGVRTIAPRTRLSVLGAMARLLETGPAGAPSLTAAADDRTRRLVVISDFLGDAESLLRAVRARVASGGEVYAVHVVAQEELDPDRTHRLVSDPEQPGLRRPMSKTARETYQQQFAAWRARLARDWRNAGVVYTLAVAGQESVGQLVRRITTHSR